MAKKWQHSGLLAKFRQNLCFLMNEKLHFWQQKSFEA